MFGNFSQGSGINKRQLLPAVNDLVIVYEAPGDVAASGGTPPDNAIVSKLLNSAPNFSSRNTSIANNTSTALLWQQGTSFDPVYGGGPYVNISNGSTSYFTSDAGITGINGGLSIFALAEIDVTGSGNPSIRLTDASSGDEATIYFTTSGSNILVRGQIGASNVDYDLGININTESGSRFLGYTTDFTNSELFVSDSGATGFTSRGTSITGTNNPGSAYSLELNASGVGNARFSLQALYVWRKELDGTEITQLTTYLNDYFIPSV